MAIKSVFTKKQRKEHYKGAIEVATKFLEAIRDEEDWRPFAQKHYSQWDLGSRPFIIKFEDFEILKPGAVSGANVDICTGIYFKLTIPELVGSLPKAFYDSTAGSVVRDRPNASVHRWNMGSCTKFNARHRRSRQR